MDLQAIVPWAPFSSSELEARNQVYYRSKIYSIIDDLSSFVAAASPIFSLLDRITLSHNLPLPEKILPNLEHELKAFCSRLNGQPHCLVAHNSLAYYMLTATVDEILARNYLRLYGSVIEFQAFTPLTYSEEEVGVKFFSILELLKQKTTEYLPLIELAYYCLMAGFEGQYNGRPDGRQKLEAEIDILFQIISQYKPASAVDLFDRIKQEKHYEKSYHQIVLIGSIILGIMFICIYLSQMAIEHKANSLRFNPNFITSVDE